MEFQNFKGNWNRLVSYYRCDRIVNLMLAVAVLILAVMVMSEEEVVVLQAPNLEGEAEVRANQASTSYQEAWSNYIATLIGNVSPSNAEFVRDSLQPLFSPSIYQEATQTLERQIAQIREENVTMSFEPQEIMTDRNTGRIYVTGIHESVGVVTQEQTRRTYVFEWEFRDHRPVLTYIRVFEGRPDLDD